MNDTYLFKEHLRVAQKFPRETVDFLVENGYAVLDRTMKFHDGDVDYYRAAGCTYDCGYCHPDDD